MIRKPTVLVLGAGASHPYGFPLGSELVDRIVADLGRAPYGPILKVLQLCGHNMEEIQELQQRLRFARPPSVDTFIQARKYQQIVTIAKRAIAAELVRCEAPTLVMEPLDPKQDWYRYLFSRVLYGGSANQFRDDRLRIVTFNFDRSLEYALSMFVRWGYYNGYTGGDADIMSVPVVHVHGQLGACAWFRQIDWTSKPRDFTPEHDLETVDGKRNDEGIERFKTIADGLRFTAEELEPAVGESVRRAFDGADVALFLGFGYHKMNLDWLYAHGLDRVKHRIGSCFGLPRSHQAFPRSQGIELKPNRWDNTRVLHELTEILDPWE